MRCEKTTEGVTLIECSEAAALLNYLDTERDFKFSPECYLRGVVIPGEGAFFDLFDSFGSSARNVVHLSEKQSHDLILSRIH